MSLFLRLQLVKYGISEMINSKYYVGRFEQKIAPSTLSS